MFGREKKSRSLVEMRRLSPKTDSSFRLNASIMMKNPEMKSLKPNHYFCTILFSSHELNSFLQIFLPKFQINWEKAKNKKKNKIIFQKYYACKENFILPPFQLIPIYHWFENLGSYQVPTFFILFISIDKSREVYKYPQNLNCDLGI